MRSLWSGGCAVLAGARRVGCRARSASLACALCASVVARAGAADAADHARHETAVIVGPQVAQFVGPQRLPFGWTAASIGGADAEPLVLQWREPLDPTTISHLRIAVALDERDDKVVEVRLARSQRLLGKIEIRFASQFQLFELPIAAAAAPAVLAEGVALRVTQGSALEVLTGGREAPPALRPHLLRPGAASPLDEYFVRMNSLACIQPFGWMEGCVLDGLLDLAELPERRGMRQTAVEHVRMFLHDDRLVYESPRGAPSDGIVSNIEATLPFAALSQLVPQSSTQRLALDFWKASCDPTGLVQADGRVTSEGAYTVAYPMAVVAQARNSPDMLRQALDQLRLRQSRLFDGRAFFRAYDLRSGKRADRNWARGVAWQMLGMARTLAVVGQRRDVEDLHRQLRRLTDWVIPYQRSDGLWSVEVDQRELLPDTAGSAGIAAALAIGASRGWLGSDARTAAERCWSGLTRHLTPDGFLRGASQSNKGGADLQRGGFRCIYQMGMGLMAQLHAALQPRAPR